MAKIGDNSGLDSKNMKLLHFHHFNLIEAKKADIKVLQDDLKKLKKTAKADGCVMADLDYMARCAGLEDPDIVPAELLRRTEIASWFALPVNFQPDMFTDRAPIDDRAYSEGYAAGMRGRDPVSPYGEASSSAQRWMEGWHTAQTEMAEALKTNMEKKLAAAKAKTNEEPPADGDPFEDDEAA